MNKEKTRELIKEGMRYLDNLGGRFKCARYSYTYNKRLQIAYNMRKNSNWESGLELRTGGLFFETWGRGGFKIESKEDINEIKQYLIDKELYTKRG